MRKKAKALSRRKSKRTTDESDNVADLRLHWRWWSWVLVREENKPAKVLFDALRNALLNGGEASATISHRWTGRQATADTDDQTIVQNKIVQHRLQISDQLAFMAAIAGMLNPRAQREFSVIGQRTWGNLLA